MTWDLLIDWDRVEDIPVSMYSDAGGTPPVSWVRDALNLRLWRAGYHVADLVVERSTNGWHGKVRLGRSPGAPAPEPIETVALQLLCGSDPMRESCNLQRARAAERAGPFWRERWNVLYRPNPNRRKAE